MTEAHRLTRIDTVGRDGFVSHCSCGWRSGPYSTAGLAGSKQTEHAEMVPDPEDE